MNNSKLVHFPQSLVLENEAAKVCELNAGQHFSSDPVTNDPDGIVNGSSSQAICLEAPNEQSAGSQALNSSGFSLSLDDFDGPIDLLLHLVKREELPIEKLSLAKVADQFLQCIKHAVGFDLELAGEYLVIATNLLSIKAALLVDPKAERQIELDEGPNPHDELLRRLREAEVYQEAARRIASKDILGIDVFAASIPASFAKNDKLDDPGLAQHDSVLLAKALNKIIASIPSPIGIKLNWTRISIGERMQFFVDFLKARPGEMVSFEELVGTEKTLPILVSSFVALLELCKRRIIHISQTGYQDSIALCLLMTEGEDMLSPAALGQSEFDAVEQSQDLVQVGNI